MLSIGCHLSSSKGNLDMVKTACGIGANTFAFFTRNPRGSKAKPLDAGDCQRAMEALEELKFGTLVAHGAYTMNLCTADPEARAFAAGVLADDLKRMSYLPGQFYNFHPGSHVGQGVETAVAQIADALKAALEPGYPVTVLLETMAGKGSEVGGKFEELRAILDAVGSEQVGVCLDTCHVYDGGYDIVNDLDGVLTEFDRVVGLRRLKALHLNDSKNPFASHKDRHECIGKGSLGLAGQAHDLGDPQRAARLCRRDRPSAKPERSLTMIIDSHAHYAHACYQNRFRYLAEEGESWEIRENDLPGLFGELDAQGIPMSIEPGISLTSNEAVLALAERYPNRIFPAVGVHPTRCFRERWADRKKLLEWSRHPRVVAIGETGLDYHHPRKEQHRLVQLGWFLWQLRLARRRQKPLVLHIRDAHEDALKILRIFFKTFPGGVVHCYQGDWETARQYLDLGLYLGIGGALLQEGSGPLQEAVERMPLERILVETDSPYVLPYCKDVLPPRQVRRLKNSSLILPRVIARIARLKGLPPRQVEQALAENARRLFGLPEA